jgi:flagellum-specific peptidoglycan hydrolase FlgJ
VVALALGLGEGERPAIATEAHAPAPAPGRRALVHFAPVEPQAIEPASAPLPSPADPPRTEDTEEDTLPAAENESESARSSITPMEKDEAVQHLSQAWREVEGEAPSDLTLTILCAHWAHETHHGRRMYGYNFGGIKGTSPSGKSVVVWTRERPDEERLVKRTFRAYDSAEEGARDYVKLLAERYSAAFRAAREHRIERFVSALGSRGYFTDDEQVYLRSLARLARACGRGERLTDASEP